MSRITCTLVGSGDSLLLPLPSALLAQLNLGEGDEVLVFVEPGRGRMIVTPADSLVAGAMDADYARDVADFIAAYRPALEALARSTG